MDAAIKTMEIKFPIGPGQRLRTAREVLKLSIDQVAHHLRLDRKLIVELEADRYENMPCFTFTRGYLRNYARLVCLSPDELVVAFDNLALEEKPIKTIEEAFVMKNYSTLEQLRRAPWIPYLIMVAAFLTGILVYEVLAQQGAISKIMSMLGLQ